MSFKFIHKKKPEQKPEQTTLNDINLSQKISPPVTPSTQKKGGFNFIKKNKVNTETSNDTSNSNTFLSGNNQNQQEQKPIVSLDNLMTDDLK